jgi:ferredoxin-nitrate reductase
MTNSERRLTYMPKLSEPPGEALPDWEILSLFGREMGFSEAFAYGSPEDIFAEFVELTANTFCDCSGISYRRLKNEGALQWPCPKPDHAGTERLYEDARFHTNDGKANLIAVEHAEPFETPDHDYPLWLTTGRSKYHWHTMTRTGKNEALRKSAPDPILEIHRVDARSLGIQDADFVEVFSRRGKVMVQARVTEEITRGTCFLPFHWGREYGFFKAANNLTVMARDPLSRQPELKACAVRVKKVLDFPRSDN